ncbi:60S ribosomal protein L21-like [Ursus arctos]|nr:60S ribosomal protein L21-like [Ursus arctos]
MRTYRKCDAVHIKEMGSIHKGMSHECYHSKTGRVYNVAQHAADMLQTNKGKILAKRISECIEQIQPSKSPDSFLQHMKEDDQEKKEAKEKDVWFKPALHFVRTNRERPELLEPPPMNS